MNNIIITSIICISFIIIVGIISYNDYKRKNNDELKYIHKRIDLINDKIIHWMNADIIEIKKDIKEITTKLKL